MLLAALAQGIFKILLALFGLCAARSMLLKMDNAGMSNFSRWLENADDLSTSIYYSSRIVAICLLVGFALS
jgi:ABC-type spermidine/putrescine transport system permease subunit I